MKTRMKNRTKRKPIGELLSLVVLILLLAFMILVYGYVVLRESTAEYQKILLGSGIPVFGSVVTLLIGFILTRRSERDREDFKQSRELLERTSEIIVELNRHLNDLRDSRIVDGTYKRIDDLVGLLIKYGNLEQIKMLADVVDDRSRGSYLVPEKVPQYKAILTSLLYSLRRNAGFRDAENELEIIQKVLS